MPQFPSEYISLTQQTQNESNTSSPGILEWIFPILVAAAFFYLLLKAHQYLIKKNELLGSEAKLPKQLTMLVLTLVGIILIILCIPGEGFKEGEMKGQILSLLGILVSGVIALASTTFVGNAMAGMMLHVIKSFRPGDFIRVGSHFGRVTERGLFHTEIQTEDRDLTTLPNMHLVTNAVTVIHSSGTIISANLSLGYDISHRDIEKALVQAAEKTGLEDPFVLIMDLNDFSVTYKIAGFYPHVKQFLTIRSELRKNVLDFLHNENIEIVSPTFMNQRRISETSKVLPKHKKVPTIQEDSPQPEQVIFDKAENAATIQKYRDELEALQNRLTDLQANAGDDDLENEEIHILESEKEQLEKRIALLIEEQDKPAPS